MFKDMKNNLDTEVNKYATKNIIKKLEKQGVDYRELSDSAFNDLIADEISILESDAKKVGSGISIGILFSLVTGI